MAQKFLVTYGQRFHFEETALHNTLYAPHIHPHFELYICLEEIERLAHINGNTIDIHGPCAILYAPYSLHANAAKKNTMYIRHSLNFGTEFLEQYSQSLNDISIIHENNSSIFMLDETRQQEIKQVLSLFSYSPRDSSRQELLTVYLLRLLQHYVKRDSNFQQISNSEALSVPDILKYIVKHIGEPLTIPKIADQFFIGTDKLNKDFKKYTGMPVHQFIINVKITIAKHELERKEKSIGQIAKELGFTNEIYFYPFFRKHTGYTPLQYRKLNKQAEYLP
ncbi:MAG: helix-turn-helix transcriptional regulator [Clostridia bacterium]|nr:helix-turn-helix transcriptional regulator [Clostridia bacterium]